METTGDNETIYLNDDFEVLFDNKDKKNKSNIDEENNDNNDNISKNEEEEIIEEEGILIDNSKYVSRLKKNSFTDKIIEKQKINDIFKNSGKNKFNKNNKNIEELKIAQIKKNTYEKDDDINNNDSINNSQNKDLKILNSPSMSDRILKKKL